MAYTTPAKVAALLGLTLTSGQQDLVTNDLEPAMRAYIDRFTGRSWGATSPVSGEAHTVYGGVVYLNQKPVSAVSAVTYRSQYIGASTVTLVAAETYELLDAATGRLLVSAPDGSLVTVSYTHGATAVPADIQHAATLLVAANLHDATLADPQLRGVRRYSIGQGDLTLDFSDETSKDYAAGALDILKLRRGMVFA